MLCSGETVTVAFSGGADSTALLVLLKDIAPQYHLNLQAAHLNHCLRGEESLRDEDFARDFCQKLSVPFFCERADIAAISEKSGESIETAARNIRYAFLRRVSGDGRIATAHNASDISETVLINLCRGSGLEGLCSIPPVNGDIIRPLYRISSEDIREFCVQNDIPFVVDSTNLTSDYTRNNIRHNCIPVLKKINPSLDEVINRQCDLLRQDADYLHSKAQLYLKESLENGSLLSEKLRELHPAVLSRLLRIFAQNSGIILDHTHTNELMTLITLPSGRRELPNGYYAELLKGRLSIRKRSNSTDFELDFSDRFASTDFGSVKAESIEKGKINNLLLKNCIDCDKIGTKLTLRNRRSGDKFTPIGRGCTKTLRKLFNEAAIPSGDRDKIFILSDEGGILWVQGFGADRRAAADENSKNILLIGEHTYE